MARYPLITVTLAVADKFVDPISNKLDLAVRIGELKDSRLMSRLLGYSRRVVIAAPEYLARYGTPQHPSDLKDHACIVVTGTREEAKWRFQLPGTMERIPVSGPITTDNAPAANAAVLAGIGIGVAQFWQVRELVEEGRYSLLLTQYEPPPFPIHAVWPPGKHLPRRTRRFIDFLAARLAADFG
jgi:DNA-binding transcriptional LysR family regulator